MNAINWKVRIKNKLFWIALIPAVLLLVQTVCSVFGIELDFGNLPVRKTESQKHLRRTLTKTVVKNIPDLNAVDGYKDITRLDTDFLGDTTRNDFLYDAVLFSSIGHLSFSSSSRLMPGKSCGCASVTM